MYASEIDEYKKKKNDIFCILPRPVSVIDAYFAISLQADKTQLNKIDKVLLQAKKSGDLDRLFAK